MRWLGLFTKKTFRKHIKLIFPHRDFIICIASSRRSVEEAIIGMVSLAIFHPHFTIRIFPSAFYHPHFSIRIFPSSFFYPPSAIRRHPVRTLKTRSPSASLPFKGQVTKKTIFARQDAVQPCKKSYMIRWSQEKSNVSVCLVKLQNSKHSGKMWLIPDQCKRILQFSLHNFCIKFLPDGRFNPGRSKLPTCGKWSCDKLHKVAHANKLS